MTSLSPTQRELVSSLVERLKAIHGIRAVVLGGSHARGHAQPDSDIDLGILYSETAPFSIPRLRELAEAVNDTASTSPRGCGDANEAGPVVTEFHGWGPWVNGGAWLTTAGQRVDLIYRSLEQVERVIADAQAGRYEVHSLQQPPFGFFSGTYLGEVAACIPLFDPEARLASLKRRVSEYPEPLRRSIVRDYLFMADFTLTAFAPKYAARSDAYGTAACLSRAVNELVMTLFALNRRYLINDKTAMAEIAELERAPRDFVPTVQQTLGHLGDSPADLARAIGNIARLHRETTALAEGF